MNVDKGGPTIKSLHPLLYLSFITARSKEESKGKVCQKKKTSGSGRYHEYRSARPESAQQLQGDANRGR